MKRALYISIVGLILAVAATSQLQAEESKNYRRVISLYAAHTEVLLRVGAGDRLVGISAQETYQGPETRGWERPPVFSIRDDPEKFLAAKPDLVLVRPMHLAAGSHLVTTLRNAGVRVQAAQVLKAEDLYQYWRDLAGLVGKQAEAERMIADFDARISAYHQAAALRPDSEKPGVFLEAVHGPIKTFTPGSIPVWLVELAGGYDVAQDAAPRLPGLIVTDYGPERLLAKAKEVDIFISQTGPMNASTIEQVRGRSIYQPLKAVKEGRVYKIPEDILARPTPSLLVGLATIAKWTGLEVAAAPLSDGGAELEAVHPADGAGAAEPVLEDSLGESEELELKVDLPPDQNSN